MTTDTDTDKAPSVSAEQAADFAALQAAAAGAPPVPGTEPEPQDNGPDLAREIEGLVSVAVVTLTPLFPSLKETYTPEITKAAAGAIAAVCVKHGWMQGGMMGEWGEEIACVAIVGPLGFSTWNGIRQDLETRTKTAKQIEARALRQDGPSLEATAPQATPGSRTVSFGGVAA